MLHDHDPEEAPTPPLARESLDRATICLGIRVLWYVRSLLTGLIVAAVLGTVCDSPTRRHSCLDIPIRGEDVLRLGPVIFTVMT